MVVAHSWAGRVLPLVAARRPVSLLVYLCARLAASPADEPLPTCQVRSKGSRSGPTEAASSSIPRTCTRAFRPRWPLQAAAALRPQYWPDPPELDVRAHPRAYVLCRDDEFAPLEWSRWAARELLGVEPVELPGGHFPMLEQPAALADALERLLEDRP